MLLIYPKTERFKAPLDPFHFSDALTLHVVPFDLQKGELVWADGAGTMLSELSRGAA